MSRGSDYVGLYYVEETATGRANPNFRGQFMDFQARQQANS